jgi:cell division protein FtsB
MRGFKKRRGGQETTHFFVALMGLALVAVIAGLACHAAWNMYTKFRIAADARLTSENELATLQEQDAKVTAAVAGLETDRGIDGQMRERFGVARPGEGEIDIVRPSNASTSSDLLPDTNNIFMRVFRALFIW